MLAALKVVKAASAQTIVRLLMSLASACAVAVPVRVSVGGGT